MKWNGDVYPCCQSYALDAGPIGRVAEQSMGEIWYSEEIRRWRRLHATGRAGEIAACARCVTTIPHPLLVVGSLLFHGRFVRRLLPAIERMTYLSKLPKSLLTPPSKGVQGEALVRIAPAEDRK